MKRSILSSVGLFLLAAAAAGSAASAASFLPYFNAPFDIEDIKAPPKLAVGFGGRTHEITMDTGSTGIVVSASAIPDFDALPQTPGQITYSSSGKIMRGQWVTVPVTISGADGTEIKTDPIPVLAVTQIDCLAHARNCAPIEAPARVSMMGVGFGREYDSQSEGTPDKNPFLNIHAESRRMQRGYIVTRTGVQVGLDSHSLDGFARIKLEPHEKVAGEWQPAPVCLSVNDATPAACGSILVDTGVTGTYLTLPPSQVGNATSETRSGELTLAPATKLNVVLLPQSQTQSKPRADYHVSVGDDGNPLAPAFIRLNLKRHPYFINTGVHFLNGFDYLYDADQGLVGYRWTGHSPPDFGEAKP